MSVFLSEHLPLLATASGGIQKLRALILELAMRGKLVPQDPADEPANELLSRVADRKAQLEIATGSKKLAAVPKIKASECPFEVPKGWQWSRLADLTQVLNGRAYSKSELLDAGTPVLRVGNLFTSNHWYYSDLELEEEKYCDAGDLIFSWSASFGPFIWKGPKVIYHYHIWKLSLFCDDRVFKEFFYKFLLEKTAEIKAAGHGVSMVHMTKEKMELLPVPVPPLAEQHRIVAKVDELMALCDRMEAEQSDAESAHARLVESLLNTLTQSTDAADLASNWQRIAEHFDALFTTEGSIDALKQSIRQLAVLGKLVKQCPTDEPAINLLKRIQKERARLEAEGICKAIRNPRNNSNDEQSANLPNGWESVTIVELFRIASGATPSKEKSIYWDGTIPWVSPKDMKVDQIVDAQDHVTALALNETNLSLVSKDSLLIVVRGMILAHSFPVAVTKVQVTINQDMKSLTPYRSEIVPFLALACQGYKKQILQLVERSTHGTCKLQSEKIFSFLFGLPPIDEQQRIVAKVDELMDLCDRMKVDLREARGQQSQLAGTLIKTALEAA